MVLVLILAGLAPILAMGEVRRVALLLGCVAVVLIVGPILVLDYDWRFMIPVFGPLSAVAAIGGFELYGALRRDSGGEPPIPPDVDPARSSDPHEATMPCPTTAG